MNTAFITGGGGRIGRAVAGRLAADGFRLVLADIDREAARDTSLAIGGSAEIVALDVTSIEAVKAEIGALAERHGPIAALINAAGGRWGSDAGAFTESDPATWRPIIDLHLRGVLNCCYAALPGMIAAKRGAIVSVAAFEGVRGDPNAAVFSAAKAGVVVLTETLVRECQPHGIRVNAVLPSPPPSLAKAGINDDASDVAEAVAFLVSERAARMNGTCLDVTGGWALH